MADDGNGLALVLSGGGARAAYQVGFLRCLARNFPDLNIPIITGVSAGAINAAFLANHTGTFAEAVEELSELWLKLSVDQVFCVDTWKLIRNVFRWGVRLVSGGFCFLMNHLREACWIRHRFENCCRGHFCLKEM